jgi:hypothetical protein
MIAAALALAACSPSSCTNNAKQDEPSEETTQTDAANGCAATASAPWAAGAETLTVEGSTTGADCASAEARLALRRGDGGGETYAQVFSASSIFTLAGASSAEDMQRRLQEWVNGAGPVLDSTGDLPEWEENAELPGNSEFPFRPYGIDRAAYAALRATDVPMFCFVQGMETQACFWLDQGALRRIGEQSFPG